MDLQRYDMIIDKLQKELKKDKPDKLVIKHLVDTSGCPHLMEILKLKLNGDGAYSQFLKDK